MNSEVKIYTRENGEIQRVQMVRLDDWQALDFLWLGEKVGKPERSAQGVTQESSKRQAQALACFRDIYANYLVPAAPWIFPQMVMFSLPENFDADSFFNEMTSEQKEKLFHNEKYGDIKDALLAVSILLEKGVKIKGGKPVFLNDMAKKLWQELEARECVHIVCGKFPRTQIIPVGNGTGYLSQSKPEAAMKVNANFFIMDPFDCATLYDQVGTVLGLCVKDGVVQNPPLFHREALLVKKDGRVSIREMDVRDLEIEIGGVQFRHGKNATIYARPERAKTPAMDGTCIVVVGNRVVAVREGGPVKIPASGFVIWANPDSFIKPRTLPNGQPMKTCPFCDVPANYLEVAPGDEVIYRGLEDVQFGIQVGNSIIRNGEKTTEFISRFYNIYHLERVPFPPSLYPMNFEKARAARIALGADADGKPVLFWAEGAGKLGYTLGADSTGASLSEMAEIASDLGLYNAVNLDGGGSAQILVDGERALRISDRKKEDNSDAERLVPLGLMVK